MQTEKLSRRIRYFMEKRSMDVQTLADVANLNMRYMVTI
jgi:hypothetical protein